MAILLQQPILFRDGYAGLLDIQVGGGPAFHVRSLHPALGQKGAGQPVADLRLVPTDQQGFTRHADDTLPKHREQDEFAPAALGQVGDDQHLGLIG